MYHLPCIFTPWFMRSAYALKFSLYFGILTCSCVWFTTACTRLNSKDDWRQVGECADTWYKQIQPTETEELQLPGNLPTHLCQSETTDGLTVLLVCDVHIDIDMALNLLQCLCVICGCRAVQTNSAETSLTGTAGDVAIVRIKSAQARPPVFHECTSMH